VFTYAVFDRHGKELRRGPITKRSNNTAWRKARVRAGLPTLRWHDLRHTWATWHAAAGTPQAVLQALGGWETAAMPARYTHMAATHLRPHANAIRLPPAQDTKKAQSEKEALPDEPQDLDFSGVADGIRTHNNRNHNPGLYR